MVDANEADERIGRRSRVTEEWRSVPGYEGIYEASNKGRVRSLDRVIVQRHGISRRFQGKILNPTIRSRSYKYQCVNLAKDTVHTFTPVHHVICLTFNGPKPFPEAVCRHLDDNSENNVPENLAWGTVLDNETDKDKNGRRPRGETHPNVYITEDQARHVLALSSGGMRQCEIRDATGMPKAMVQRIVSRTTWKHLEDVK